MELSQTDTISLRNYASFLLDHHLDTLIIQTTKRAEEINLPLLRLFKDYPKSVRYEYNKQSLISFLTKLSNGEGLKDAEDSARIWKTNSLSGIPQDEFSASDIALVHNIRKYSLINLILHFTQDIAQYNQLVLEIEDYYLKVLEITFKAYIETQEDKFNKKNELLEKIIIHNVNGIVALDKTLKYTIWNPVMEKITGMPKEKVIGKSIQELFPNYLDEEELNALQEALNGNEFYIRDKKYSKLKGYYESYVSPLFDEKSKVSGVVAIVHDITERKKAEEKIRSSEEELKKINNELEKRVTERTKELTSSEERYRVFIKQISEGIWRFEMDRTLYPDTKLPVEEQIELFYKHAYLAECNDAMAKMYGFTKAEEVIGTRIKDLLAFSNPLNEDLFRKFINSGYRLIDAESVEKDNKGNTKYFLNNVIGIIENERLIRVWGNQRDITDRKIYEEQLLRINNDLDNFIYTASHDLKAPIVNIEGLMNTLSDSLPQEILSMEDFSIIMNMVKISIRRFKETIEDMTDITKATKNISEDITEINICKLLEHVTINMREDIKNSGAIININTSYCPILKFSKKNLTSVLYNLISNAIKYKSPERNPEIHINTEDLKNWILIKVQDNGLGIPADKTHKIFTMFKRLHDHVEGTGIGLYIVKRIMDNAGGKIEVESEEGRGTLFKLYFPFKQANSLL